MRISDWSSACALPISSAGATEFDFISGLVQNGRIPDDVTPQVLTQSRADLIRTSFDSLAGAKTAIVHVYNAVSPAWRKIVFGMDMPAIKDIAIDGAKQLRSEEHTSELQSLMRISYAVFCFKT